MSSNINPNTININYPLAGVDNDSQGFRDNFTNIQTALITASDEITDLQDVKENALLIDSTATTIIDATLYNYCKINMVAGMNISLAMVFDTTLNMYSTVRVEFANEVGDGNLTITLPGGVNVHNLVEGVITPSLTVNDGQTLLVDISSPNLPSTDQRIFYQEVATFTTII